ncbi:HipA family kinase [Thiobacillus sp.]
MSLTVVEVLERSVQGRTEPYVCRCDDGEVYFVKGRSATRPRLIAEWLCARLAEQFGLPIAPYAIATVPDELIEADLTGWLRDLGAGEVFASQRVTALELNEVHRDLVPEKLRRDVIAFDWWVRNGDRNMTAMGGNPNLLWNPADGGSLVVIDHNLAFDPAFSEEDFLKLHVFADDIPAMFSDFLVREAYRARFAGALGIWTEACDNLPKSWGFVDPEQTIPVGFSLDEVRGLLDRALLDTFWQLPTP